MYYVYVLYSKKDKRLYIGSTPDLKKRLHKHNYGSVISTKNRRPLELIYYEAYVLRSDSSRREKYLKSGAGRKELAKQLEDIYDKLRYNYSKQ
jgi:putative endonuclease